MRSFLTTVCVLHYFKRMVHIGEEIKRVVEERNIKVVDLARRINTDRNNIYNIYRRRSIDTDLLSKISETLNYDFFKLCSSHLLLNKVVHNSGNSYHEESAPEKLLQLLEESIRILEERLTDKEEIIRLLKQQNA